MRKDYEYIQNAISVQLVSTEEGSKVIEALIDEDIESPELTQSPEVETLLFLDSEYVTIQAQDVDRNHGVSLKQWYDRLCGTYIGYDAAFDIEKFGLTYERFVKMWTDEFLAVSVVIWD